jgi:hypothetical protein
MLGGVLEQNSETDYPKCAYTAHSHPIAVPSREESSAESMHKEATPDELPAILFKSGTLRDNKLYTCTSTEVMGYDLPSFRLATYISLPFFSPARESGAFLLVWRGHSCPGEVGGPARESGAFFFWSTLGRYNSGSWRASGEG